MEHQSVKESILSSVEYTNLLTVTLTEHKLERNFKLLVQALGLSQSQADDLSGKVECLQKTSNNHSNQLAQLQQQMRLLQEKLLSTPPAQVVASVNSIPTVIAAKQGAVSNKSIANPVASNSTLPTIIPPIPAFIPPLQESVPSVKHIQPRNSVHSHSANVSQLHEGINQKDLQAFEMQIMRKIEADFVGKKEIDKKFNEMNQNIGNMKGSICNIDSLQKALQQVKKQLNLLKGQLATINFRSFKQVKRESINQSVLQKIEVIPSKKEVSKGTISLQKIISSKRNSAVDVNKENQNDEIKENEPEQQINGQNLQREFNGLHIEVNTLNICLEQLKQNIYDLTKKQNKTSILLNDTVTSVKKIQQNQIADYDNLQKSIKQLNLQMMELALNKSQSGQNDKKLKQSQKAIKNVERGKQSQHHAIDNAFKNSVNEKLTKIQFSLKQFVSNQQFSRLKNQLRQKDNELQTTIIGLRKQFEEQLKKLLQLVNELKAQELRSQNNMLDLNEKINQTTNQIQRKHNIAISRVEQLKKGIQNLREDVQYYQIQSKQKDEKPKQESDKKDTVRIQKTDSKGLEELKRSLTNKMHDQRTYLLGQIRDIEKKFAVTNSIQSELASVWDKINEVSCLGARKVDCDDLKKSLTYLQKKIIRIANTIVKEEQGTEDARAAKTNWLCLSCDQNLNNYQGRIGRHVVWNSIPKKTQVFPSLTKK